MVGSIKWVVAAIIVIPCLGCGSLFNATVSPSTHGQIERGTWKVFQRYPNIRRAARVKTTGQQAQDSATVQAARARKQDLRMHVASQVRISEDAKAAIARLDAVEGGNPVEIEQRARERNRLTETQKNADNGVAEARIEMQELDKKIVDAGGLVDPDAAIQALRDEAAEAKTDYDRKIAAANLKVAEAEQKQKEAQDKLAESLQSKSTTPAEREQAASSAESATNAAEAQKESLSSLRERLDSQFARLLSEDEEKAESTRAFEIGTLTRTTAVTIIPADLEVVQPGIVQSFSLRNFFQLFNAESDFEYLSSRVETDVAMFGTIKSPDASEEFDLSKLTTEQRQLIVHAIVDERLAERWWHTRLETLSLDIGLTHQDLALGRNEAFDRRVDDEFPEFLIGLGFHFGKFEVSVGGLLYRRADNQNMDMTYYVGLGVDLLNKSLFSDSEATP